MKRETWGICVGCKCHGLIGRGDGLCVPCRVDKRIRPFWVVVAIVAAGLIGLAVWL